MHQNGFYLFQFIPEKVGQISLRPFVRNENNILSVGANVKTLNVTERISSDPLISIVSPSNESIISDTSAIRIFATATDPDGNIENVKFYVNGLEVNSTDYNASFLQPNFAYGTTWTPDVNGTQRDLCSCRR